MTREEAWRKAKGYLYDALDGEKAEEIIKALEQEPCEDCISREKAIVQLSWDLSDVPLPKIKESLDKLPSVTPTRKQGKWVTKFHGFPPEPYTACSNCDYDIDFEISKLVKADAFTIKPYRPKFCPNCGAEMESNQ